MFRGRFVHTMDSKGRISIPQGFRLELQRQSEGAPILTNSDQCLLLFPSEEWRAFEEQIVGLSSFDPDVLDFGRMMISGASECPIDAQGRILVPPVLREHARLEREAVIAGCGQRLEIWDKTRFDADLQKTQARFLEISSAISDMAKLQKQQA
jgi:MraZ protein